MATNNATNIGIVPGGGQTYTFPAATSTLATIALSETLTSKTLTSPIISGAGGTTAGQQGYNATDKAILIGDGAANQTMFTSAWKTWTPTWGGFTKGSATIAATYTQVGKLIVGRIGVRLAADSSVTATITWTWPVTAIGYTVTTTIGAVGVGRIYDNGGSIYETHIIMNSTTTGKMIVMLTSGTYASNTDISSTIPMTWATNDEFSASFMYEAA